MMYINKRVYNCRTKEYVLICCRWDHYPTTEELYRALQLNHIKNVEQIELVECDAFYMIVKNDANMHYTHSEKLAMIREAYQPQTAFRAESVYINKSTMSMVELKNFYHSLVFEFGDQGVDLIRSRAEQNLFSRAYLDAFLRVSAGGRDGWILPTAREIFSTLEVLKKRNAHVDWIHNT